MNESEIKKKEKRRKLIGKIVAYTILSIGGAIMIIPFIWMLSTSLKSAGDVFVFPPKWIPKPILWRNYIDAWNAVPFNRFFINSIFVSVSVTLGQVATSCLAAYAFARLNFIGREKLFLGYLATMMIPGQVTMIPVFILLKKLNWIDTYQALIIPGIFSAYGTFMLRQFFMTIPNDLIDAAKIDGCSQLGILTKIVVPLSTPAIATLATFTFLGVWNDFMWPLIVTNSMEMKTLPVGLASFQGLYTTDWTLLMAASTIVLIPVIIVYVFNQKFFVKGIVLSGIKG